MKTWCIIYKARGWGNTCAQSVRKRQTAHLTVYMWCSNIILSLERSHQSSFCTGVTDISASWNSKSFWIAENDLRMSLFGSTLMKCQLFWRVMGNPVDWISLFFSIKDGGCWSMNESKEAVKSMALSPVLQYMILLPSSHWRTCATSASLWSHVVWQYSHWWSRQNDVNICELDVQKN